MTLALRLVLSFGLLALVATGVVGFGVREAWRSAEEQRFEEQLRAAGEGVTGELVWETSQLRDLLPAKCQHDAYIDQTLIELERHELDGGRRLAVSQVVAAEMKALHLDELSLLTGEGEVLGAGHDPAGAGRVDAALAAQLRAAPGGLGFRGPSPAHEPALVSTCSRSLGAHRLFLSGARHLQPMLTRIGDAYGVRLTFEGQSPSRGADEAARAIDALIPELAGLHLVASVSRRTLEGHLAFVDRRIMLASLLTLGVAIVTAIAMARSVAKPLEALAEQAGAVVQGEPRPVHTTGSRELRAFARAFNQSIDDLTELRKRLATTERIAARREIARQVAHEIKNPLAPIRAAVETLRRLRARGDPAFDAYFDEATRTVLDEVFRISRIVSAFTEFARLPAPNPETVQVEELVRRAAALYVAGGASIVVRAQACPTIAADRDQLTQVLTNLVQNALDAARSAGKTPLVSIDVRPEGRDHVEVAVADNGPGVAPEMLARLFEPYATDKIGGTGLGLAIVQRIVDEHGGSIAYEAGAASVMDGSATVGAIFRVRLPITAPVGRGPRSAPAQAAAPRI